MDLQILKQRAKAFDHLFDAVIVTDMEGTIIDWNTGSEALYGYTKEEALGQRMHILHVPEDAEHIAAGMLSAVLQSETWTGEIRMLHKDGHTGWVESICVVMCDDDGQMIGMLSINRDITKRRKESERLEHLVHYDQLTNIPNRFLLLDRIKHLIAQSQRDKRQFALLFIDLDKFKMMNGTKDHVVQEIASLLKKAIRGSDTVARFGGDEFVVLLENITHKDDALTMVDTIAQALKIQSLVHGQVCEIRCSIGVALFPEDGTSTDELVTKADTAMYISKSTY